MTTDWKLCACEQWVLRSLKWPLTCRPEMMVHQGSPPHPAKSLQSRPTLCNPIDGSPPGSSVPGILQARILEWVAISFSTAWKWKVKVKSESKVAQSCPSLSDPMDCSPPGSSVHGILQARVLEWGAIAFSTSPPWPSSMTTLSACAPRQHCPLVEVSRVNSTPYWPRSESSSSALKSSWPMLWEMTVSLKTPSWVCQLSLIFLCYPVTRWPPVRDFPHTLLCSRP